MVYNVLLYVICGMVRDSWILPLDSIVTYAAGLKTIDFIVEGIDRFQISKMKDIVHTVDERAYITISEVADVFKSNI